MDQLRFRFSILQLLMATTLLAAACMLGTSCILLAIASIAYCVLYQSKIVTHPMATLAYFLVAVIVPAILTLPDGHPIGRRISHCMNNQQSLMLALLSYESRFQQFPVAGSEAADQELAHSWRVSILPDLGETELFARYNFDEPWDGPNNRKLQFEMPDVFRCPFDKDAPPGTTRYKLVVGPGTLFEKDKERTLLQIKDGPFDTIALVEDARPINWMKPEDLTIDQVIESIYSNEPQDAPHYWKHNTVERWYRGCCATFDGRAYAYPPGEVGDPRVRSGFTINDGQTVSVGHFDESVVFERIRYEVYLCACLFLVLVIAVPVQCVRSELRRRKKAS